MTFEQCLREEIQKALKPNMSYNIPKKYDAKLIDGVNGKVVQIVYTQKLVNGK